MFNEECVLVSNTEYVVNSILSIFNYITSLLHVIHVHHITIFYQEMSNTLFCASDI